ncbi:hypothetical protein M9H77_14604 [Catharanthus roseus]|uniref:Uncharacterized protein n=1 Tax=Catharanthus roseus TaxID=4058 RepID=A0ACC0BNI6_CATRO|nr:hypothetical protein M9H77_14604 [Catharanthus roseus]
MGHSNIWNSHPNRVCGNSHGIIRKYGLMCCRQCFRSNAKEIGFIKSFRSFGYKKMKAPYMSPFLLYTAIHLLSKGCFLFARRT